MTLNNKEFNLSISKRIRDIRVQKSLTQDEVAGKMFTSQNAYCRIETGSTRLTILNLLMLAEILDFDIVEFVNDISVRYINSQEQVKLMCVVEQVLQLAPTVV
jgi:transcriptional regulator with XRE-family HTH domain